LAAPMFLQSLSGETTEFLRVAREFLFPGGFVPQGFNDLRGDGVLFVLRKRGNFAQRVFGQCGHQPKFNTRLRRMRWFDCFTTYLVPSIFGLIHDHGAGFHDPFHVVDGNVDVGEWIAFHRDEVAEIAWRDSA